MRTGKYRLGDEDVLTNCTETPDFVFDSFPDVIDKILQ